MPSKKEEREEDKPGRAALVVFYNDYEAGAASASVVFQDSMEFLKTAPFEVVPVPAMVHDIATARQAGTFIKSERLDPVIIHLATWTGDDLLLEMRSSMEWRPSSIILWALRDINSGSLCGCQQFSMVLMEHGWDTPDLLIGRNAETIKKMSKRVPHYAPQSVASWIFEIEAKDETVKSILLALRRLRVGIIGARTPGMMEVAYDEFGILGVIGPSIHAIPVAELENCASMQSNSDIATALASFKKTFIDARITVSQEAIDEAMRNYLALKELIAKHDLDAVTVDCYPGYMGKVCIAFSMLADEGIPCACEADVHAAILAWIMQQLSGKPTNHIDTLDVDPLQNTLTGGHCGSCSIQLARQGSATIAPVRLANEGVCVVFPEKEGPVTLVNLVGRGGSMSYQRSTFRVLIITGTVIEAGLVFPGNPAVIRLDVPVDKFLATVNQNGLGHHWIVGQGTHYIQTLDQIFRALNVRVHKVL